MNKQAELNSIYQAAFENEIEKIAVTGGAVSRAVAGRAMRAMGRATPASKRELLSLINSEARHSGIKARDSVGDYLSMIQATIPKKGKITMGKLFGGKNRIKRSMGEYHVSTPQMRKLRTRHADKELEKIVLKDYYAGK